MDEQRILTPFSKEIPDMESKTILSGFTLIELLVTVAVVVVLLVVGVPEYRRMTENNRQVAAIADFIAGLDVSEDIKTELSKVTPHNYTGIVDY